MEQKALANYLIGINQKISIKLEQLIGGDWKLTVDLLFQYSKRTSKWLNLLFIAK